MKKFMISASALALSGSMAFAMDEDAMDEEMMMEATAPSVTLTGEGELGFKNVDQDTMPNAETLQLIRKYKVGFASSSTTDGGLVFGAGISIIDEQGDPDETKAVGGSNVYIGAADGTWKLKLGGNDPGIDVAGIIGVASEDGFFDGGDNALIGLEGAFGGTEYRFTMADPQLAKGTQGDGDWSAGVRHSLGDYSVGFGMDSEGGLALGLGATLQGVGVDMVYSKADESAFDQKTRHTDLKRHTSDPLGTLAYKRKSLGRQIFEANQRELNPLTTEYTKGGVSTATYKDGTGERAFDHDGLIQSLGTNYGSAEWDGLGLKVTIPAGEGVKLTAAYSQREGKSGMGAGNYQINNGRGIADDPADGALINLVDFVPNVADTAGTIVPPTAAQITAAQNAVVTGSQEVKKIELGLEYVLGGGATLKAAVKKEDHETTATLSAKGTGSLVAASGDDPSAEGYTAAVDSVSHVFTDSITTLELKIAFSF